MLPSPMSNNVEGLTFRPIMDIVDHEQSAYQQNNTSSFIGQSSSVEPLCMQHSGDAQMMQLSSSCVGSLDDIVTAKIKEVKWKWPGWLMGQNRYFWYGSGWVGQTFCLVVLILVSLIRVSNMIINKYYIVSGK